MMLGCSIEAMDYGLTITEVEIEGEQVSVLIGVADLDDMGVLCGNREGGLAEGNTVFVVMQDGLCGKE